MAEKTFVTDMNDRERQRLSSVFDQLKELSDGIADALRSGEDLKVLVGVMTFTAMYASILGELGQILHAGQQVEVPDDAAEAEGPQRPTS